MKKRISSGLTTVLLIITAVMAYENVISDDKEVRDLAKKTATEAAGCGGGCRMSGFRGDRGMIHETIEYDFDPQGHYVISCRRAYVAIGDYSCTVTEGKMNGSASAPAASSAPTPRPSH